MYNSLTDTINLMLGNSQTISYGTHTNKYSNFQLLTFLFKKSKYNAFYLKQNKPKKPSCVELG